MYGKWWYAQFLYWNTTRLNQKESQFDIELIWFNTYTFSDIIISNIPDTYDKNTIDIQTYEHSSHGLGLSNWLIRDKTITINWRILAENENELEKKIKRIKANLLTWNWTLYLKKSDWILQTKASVTKLEIPRESWTINSVNITIIFKILDPFFYSTKMNEIWYFNI